MPDKVYESMTINEALLLLLNSTEPVKGKALNKNGRWEASTYLLGVYKYGGRSADYPFRCDSGDYAGFTLDVNKETPIH